MIARWYRELLAAPAWLRRVLVVTGLVVGLSVATAAPGPSYGPAFDPSGVNGAGDVTAPSTTGAVFTPWTGLSAP